MKKETLIEIIAYWFIVLLVYTATDKLAHLITFRAMLLQSPLLQPVAGWFSLALPVSELTIAALLLFPQTRLYGYYATTIAMILFTIYVGYMLAVSAHLPCSCGGVLKSMTWKQHLLFNMVCTLLAAWGLYNIENHYPDIRTSRKPAATE